MSEWQMRKLPMDSMPSEDDGWAFSERKVKEGRPVVYTGTFKLRNTGDTFLDMSEAGKGIVFVNGHNLGRYWNVGPQQTLYVPGVWLKKGNNTITIFEQAADRPVKSLKAVSEPVLNDLKTDL